MNIYPEPQTHRPTLQCFAPERLAPVLENLVRRPRPPTGLTCWMLLQSTAAAPRPGARGGEYGRMHAKSPGRAGHIDVRPGRWRRRA